MEEEQDSGQVYTVTVEITDDEFIVDLRGNPDQDSGPFNMSGDDSIVACQMAFKNVTGAGAGGKRRHFPPP